jgi:leucyl/phenylalanyl-tRNA---protein transferase
MIHLTPALLVRAYARGIFPMAESADSDELMWFDPPERGILPLESLHIPRRLRRTVRQAPFTVRINSDFRGVMLACGAESPDRPNTWINGTIIDAYCSLHQAGAAHSVECWQDGELTGGLYGVSLGGAFFGESMFSRVTDASKVALVHLLARLVQGGYALLDTQFVTEHLSQFGARDISRDEYQSRLHQALALKADFHRAGVDEPALVEFFLQSMTQTS